MPETNDIYHCEKCNPCFFCECFDGNGVGGQFESFNVDILGLGIGHMIGLLWV